MLSRYVEEISDDFHSTFMVCGTDTLQNMIGDNEFDELKEVIGKYLPNTDIYIHKILDIPTRSLYLISTTDIGDKLWNVLVLQYL